MMGTPKPIETKYAGYRFRSRLEARWAVYFDALGISWEYEPEGYDLGQMGRYLPDFRIDQKWFVEVKPLIHKYEFMEPVAWKNIDIEVARKCYGLAKGLKTNVMVVCGEPRYETEKVPGEAEGITYDYTYAGFYGVKYVGNWFDLPFDDRHFVMEMEQDVHGYSEYRDMSWFDGSFNAIERLWDIKRADPRYMEYHEYSIGPYGICFPNMIIAKSGKIAAIVSSFENDFPGRVIDASKLATQARFEHGEITRVEALPEVETSDKAPF